MARPYTPVARGERARNRTKGVPKIGRVRETGVVFRLPRLRVAPRWIRLWGASSLSVALRRREWVPVAALAVGFAATFATALPSARGDGKKDNTIAVEDIKPGTKGYGLSVFRGTEPERFDVEVVDVLKNFRPGQALILVKTDHPRLAITKNVKGMSGSPIYFGGKLAGAYAYSWNSFQVEAIAGVTPIAPMLAEMRRPIPKGFWPLEGQAPLPGARTAKVEEATEAQGPGKTAFSGTPGSYDLAAHRAEMVAHATPPGADAVPVATPIMIGGLGPRTSAFARTLLEPLGLDPLEAGGGGGGPVAEGAPTHFVDGGSLGVSFVRGDVSFFGLGTVTHVDGSRVVGFGHPMFEAGTSAMPADLARVLWIFASSNHSSKIGESIRPLGTLIQDRQSAVVVDEKIPAPMFPLTVVVNGAQGAPKNSWKMDVAEERFLGPGFLAAAIGGALEATIQERRDVTWRLASTIKVRGRAPIVLEDVGLASGGMPDTNDIGRAKVVRLVGDILNNPWENTHIESIATTMDVRYTRDALRLRGIDVLDPEPEPGARVRLRLHLIPQLGPETTKVIEVTLPAEFAGETVDLDVQPGWEVARDVAAPETLDQLLANAKNASFEPKGIVVSYRQPAAVGLAYRGHVATRLPSFAVEAMRSQRTDVAAETIPTVRRVPVPMDVYIEGRDRVRVKIRSVVR